MQMPASSVSADVFSAMKSAWGVQAFGQMFAGMSDEEWQQTCVRWDRALGGFDRSVIDSALSDFVRRGDSFPPKLPQLLAACNAKGHAAKQPALALDQPRTSQAKAQRNLERVHSAVGQISAPDPMLAYNAPKSAIVVRILIDAARRDERMRRILLEHRDTGFERCRSDAAAAELRRFFASPPAWIERSQEM